MIELSRDVTATPASGGKKVLLPKGSKVEVTDMPGDGFTVLTDLGTMRVEPQDGDALGFAAAPAPPAGPPPDAPTAERGVWDALKTCHDPEIPVNIVELGLVYNCAVSPLPEGGFAADVLMTLTAPGCPLAPMIQADVEGKVRAVPGIRQVRVEITFDPPWDPSRMSEAARLQLGMM